MLKVQCPRCKQQMLYQPKIQKKTDLKQKSKRCVYCGFTFKIYKAPHDHQIKTPTS